MTARRFGGSQGAGAAKQTTLPAQSAWLSLIAPLLVYGSIAGPLLWWAREQAHPVGQQMLIAVGLFGLWRYGWQLLNYCRAFIYARRHFPQLRRQADAAMASRPGLPRLFVIVASYLEEPWVTVEAFQSLMANLAQLPCESTVVVAVGDDAGEALIAALYSAHPGRAKVELVFQRQSHGKRIAMGHALRAVARRSHDEPNGVTVFLDGDSWLEPRALERTLGFFHAFRDLGAVTTNEVAFIHGASPWYRDWFNLKFGQRHVLFQSHSLSHKVLTLTGRFSVLRTSIVVTEDFITAIENDVVTHWAHGSFRFLMGDDKSSWFQVLSKGWNMLYLPDVTCCSLESRDIGFFKASLSLPYRWFGNTLRNNPRALALGPRRTGWFIWFAILDQRLSMWTSLVGVSGALALSLTKSFFFLPLYAAWTVLVRLGQSMVIVSHGHPVSLRTVPIMLYTQWVGSVIKIHAWFHLADQSWGKGKSKQSAGSALAARHLPARVLPLVMMVMCCLAFGFSVLVTHGALRMPELGFLPANAAEVVIDARMYGVTPNDGQDDAAALQTLIDRAEGRSQTTIRLPAGQLDFFSPVVIRSSGVHLRGAGREVTRIVSHLRTPADAMKQAGPGGAVTAVISVQGSLGREAGVLAKALGADDLSLQLQRASAGLKAGDVVLLKQANDDALFTELGSQQWRREYPYLRQALLRVVAVNGAALQLEKPTGIAFSAGSGQVWQVNALADVVLAGFTVEQRNGERRIAEVAHRYDNLAPEVAVDGVALNWTAGAVVEDMAVINAGRNPVSFENSLGFALRGCTLDGAWNKGDGGSGYLRIARSYRGEVKDCQVRNIRHIALQWSSAFNHIHHVATEVDVNFHGGYTHHNTVDAMQSNVPAAHRWGAVTRTPAAAGWAPPDGVGNTFSTAGGVVGGHRVPTTSARLE